MNPNHTRLPAFLIIVLSVLMQGCFNDTDPSNDVDTSQTYLDMRVSASHTGRVSASVQLLNANPVPDNQINLSQGDELWFSYGGNIVQLVQANNGNLFDGFAGLAEHVTQLNDGDEILYLLWFGWLIGDNWYNGFLDEVDGEIYYLSYLRNDFRDAINSFVTLPELFSITAPLANEQHSRANDIVVNWTPSGTASSVDISVYLNCNTGMMTSHRVFFSVGADSGSYTLSGGALMGSSTSGNCATTIEVAKSNSGTVDPVLYGGAIAGERFDTVTITTTD